MRTLLRWLGALVLLAGVAAAGVGWLLFQGLEQPYRGYADAEQFVEIPSGTGTVGIGQRLFTEMKPLWLRIGGYWYPRGGIPIDVFWQSGAPPKDVWIPDQDVPGYRGRG